MGVSFFLLRGFLSQESQTQFSKYRIDVLNKKGRILNKCAPNLQ